MNDAQKAAQERLKKAGVDEVKKENVPDEVAPKIENVSDETSNEEVEVVSSDPVFKPKTEFATIWHNGTKQVLQDGCVFHHATKVFMEKL